jgi:hypothetical protein
LGAIFVVAALVVGLLLGVPLASPPGRGEALRDLFFAVASVSPFFDAGSFVLVTSWKILLSECLPVKPLWQFSSQIKGFWKNFDTKSWIEWTFTNKHLVTILQID